MAWHFVRGERLPAELDDLVLARAGALFEHDVRLGELTLHLVFDTADGNEGNSGMARQDALDLRRIHVETGRENHVLLPIDDEDAAVLVHPCQIAGVEPPIGFDRFARHFFVAEVALHDDRATHHQLADVIRRHRPRGIVDVSEDDAIMSMHFDVDRSKPIPGIMALRYGVTFEHDGYTPTWKGIYDDDGRLMVIINFNVDLGDAWEMADEAWYPEEYTSLAYRFGVNFVLYAMTH